MYNRIIGLIGPTGSGKSYTAAIMMEQAERCAVYQLKRIHEEPAFVMVADDVVDGNLQEFIVKLSDEQFKLVYLCKPPDAEGKRLKVTDLETFIHACYVRERMVMIIDEAHFFCDPWHMPVFFRQAVVMGRSRYLDIVYCAQKFSTISKELTANTHELYMWKIIEPGDLASIGERCGTDVAEAVQNLRPSQDNRRDGEEFIPGEYVHCKNTGEWEVIDPWKKDSTSASASASPSESASAPPTESSAGPEGESVVTSAGSESGTEESASAPPTEE